MSQLEIADNKVGTDTQKSWSAYVPPLQRTEGQPEPIAANGGVSYMSFDREGMRGPQRHSRTRSPRSLRARAGELST